jgi:dihydrofolate reductase
VSDSLTDPAWNQTTVISGDVAAKIRELKARPGGELLVVGSAGLARWLLAQELVDELNLVQFPVILGAGKRLFPQNGPDLALELLESRVFRTGVLGLTYRVGGRPEYA